MDLTDKKILVTGGAGFLGSHVVERLSDHGVRPENILVTRSQDFDLRKFGDCERAVKGRDVIIHLAAKVGGIGYNQAKPGELFYDNMIMGAHMIEAAHREGVAKFVEVGTICVY